MAGFVGKNLGRYHIIEPLGEGGMAAVFKAFDTTLERTVAIKVIRTEKISDPNFIKRFKQEAKSLAKLEHPNIVHINDYGEQDGIPYVVMAYLPGGTLKDRLVKQKSKPMPYQEAACLLASVARALDYAHKQKIIHRDVKPANVLITASDVPMLLDFGIAKLMEETAAYSGNTMAIGTPFYMPPEQWAGNVEPCTDVYALGVVFYEMVIGRCPFVADTLPAIMHKHIYDPMPRPQEYGVKLPDAVEGVLIKALQKKPEDRYADMGAFAAALEELARGVKAEDNVTIEIQPKAQPKRSSISPLLTGGLAGLLVMAIAIIMLFATGVIGGGKTGTGGDKPAQVSPTVAQAVAEASEPVTPSTASATPQPSETIDLMATATPLVETTVEGGAADRPEKAGFLDEFDGQLRPEWSWLNERSTHWSLDAVTGKLRIISQTGGLIGEQTYNNILLQDAPQGDFEIETQFSYLPTQNYQSAGLIIYLDNDNWLQYLYQFCENGSFCAGNGREITTNRERSGEMLNSFDVPFDAGSDSLYLKISRQGAVYTCSFSLDGTNWQILGTYDIAESDKLKVGLITLNGSSNAPEIPADFEYVRVTGSGVGTPEGVMFEDDFEDGSADDWMGSNGWKVIQDETGNYVYQGQGVSENEWAYTYPDASSTAWTDYTLEVDFRVVQAVTADTGEGLIAFRTHFDDNATGCLTYNISFATNNNWINLHRFGFVDCEWTMLSGKDFDIGINQWHHVRVEALGDHYVVYIDDQYFLETRDDMLLNGRFELDAAPGGVVQYDNVRVMAPGY